MEFRKVTPADYETVRIFLSAQGWQHRVADPERFRIMMAHTGRAVVALDDSRIVGFARALCDEVSNGYISMVVVADAYRGQGTGRKLVEMLVGDNPNITWVLRSDRNSHGFWERLGFRHSKVAMERQRQSG